MWIRLTPCHSSLWPGLPEPYVFNQTDTIAVFVGVYLCTILFWLFIFGHSLLMLQAETMLASSWVDTSIPRPFWMENQVRKRKNKRLFHHFVLSGDMKCYYLLRGYDGATLLPNIVISHVIRIGVLPHRNIKRFSPVPSSMKKFSPS